MRRIERFDKYLKYKGLNDNKVTREVGLSVGTLGKSRKENRDLSNRNVELLSNFYSDLSRTWLLTGEGEMLVSSPSGATVIGNEYHGSNSGNVAGGDINIHSSSALSASGAVSNAELLPVVPPPLATKENTDVYQVLSDGSVPTELYPSFAMFPDVKLYYTVRLDAMLPDYKPGDVLAMTPFPESGTIVAGHPYIIDTYSTGFIFRLVYDRGDHFECRPINTTSQYEFFVISKTDVIRVYRILGLVRLV